MKITVTEARAFYNADWTPLVPKGTLADHWCLDEGMDYDTLLTLDPTEVRDSVEMLGVIAYQGPRNTSIDWYDPENQPALDTLIRKWRKLSTHRTFAVEIPLGSVAGFEEFVKTAGGRIIEK